MTSDTPIADALSGLAGVSSSSARDARYAKAVVEVASAERDAGRWRFCVEEGGFPERVEHEDGYGHAWRLATTRKTVYADSPRDAVDGAMHAHGKQHTSKEHGNG